jgi:cobalt-zinc-cadmium efflux system outer membrane protein
MTPRTRWIRILMGSVASVLLLNATRAQSQPLQFDEVLSSVTAHDPRIRRAVEEVRRAKGVTTEARGAFDPRIDGDLSLTGGAYYDLRSANAELRQPTSLWGSEIYVGYRVGVSINQRWPTYRSDQTLSGGELRAGIELPIWRGGVIDEPRAERARAIHLEEAAEEDLSSAALNLELAAAGAYWSWVSAGQKLEVTKALLALAEDRDTQLRRRLAAGSIAEFDVTDNERILLERRAFLVSAQRSFEQAAFGLSLFLRDPAGRSVVPDPSRLPKEAVRSAEPELAEDLVQSRVLACHPELGSARA